MLPLLQAEMNVNVTASNHDLHRMWSNTIHLSSRSNSPTLLCHPKLCPVILTLLINNDRRKLGSTRLCLWTLVAGVLDESGSIGVFVGFLSTQEVYIKSSYCFVICQQMAEVGQCAQVIFQCITQSVKWSPSRSAPSVVSWFPARIHSTTPIKASMVDYICINRKIKHT